MNQEKEVSIAQTIAPKGQVSAFCDGSFPLFFEVEGGRSILVTVWALHGGCDMNRFGEEEQRDTATLLLAELGDFEEMCVCFGVS